MTTFLMICGGILMLSASCAFMAIMYCNVCKAENIRNEQSRMEAFLEKSRLCRENQARGVKRKNSNTVSTDVQEGGDDDE